MIFSIMVVAASTPDFSIQLMFCYIYLKLSIEVKYLLDSRIYFQNSGIILLRNRENFCLEVANIMNIFISIGLLVYEIWL